RALVLSWLVGSVTTMPPWLFGLPFPPRPWAPRFPYTTLFRSAVADGGVVSTSLFAAPAVPVAVKVTGLPVSPAAVAVSVLVPAGADGDQAEAAASPSVPVGTGLVGVTVPFPGAVANVTATPDT